MSPRWRWFVTLVLTFSLLLIIFIAIISRELLMTAESMYEEYEPPVVDTPTIDTSALKDSEGKSSVKPLVVLLLGVDERADNKGRSDTMIVLALNPKEKTTKLIH